MQGLFIIAGLKARLQSWLFLPNLSQLAWKWLFGYCITFLVAVTKVDKGNFKKKGLCYFDAWFKDTFHNCTEVPATGLLITLHPLKETNAVLSSLPPFLLCIQPRTPAHKKGATHI